MKVVRNLQSNVIRIQHALNSSKFSCFLCFSLDRTSDSASLSKKPLTMAVSELDKTKFVICQRTRMHVT
jgi:hypothetical protein